MSYTRCIYERELSLRVVRTSRNVVFESKIEKLHIDMTRKCYEIEKE